MVKTTLKNSNQEVNKIHLPAIIGKGYRDFWLYRGRYRVVKGSRASKKSKTTALWFIVNLIKYPNSNLLVVRKTFRTLKDSCFTELKWAINRLGVSAHFKITSSPLQIEYIPTGQMIYFRGLDDPLKVTSITVDNGYLCWLWIEEAYEILNEADFNILDESIRGAVAENLFKQITITFNPWNDKHWLKAKFFDTKDDDIFATTTNYLCNEWLDEADLKVFETMKEKNPKRYKVAGLGDWGVVEGVVFENWEELNFNIDKLRYKQGIKAVFGLDFGYMNDPTALFCGLVDMENKNIYVFDEMYDYKLQTEVIYKKILDMGYSKEIITADNADGRLIDKLQDLGIRRIRRARKGADSIRAGIDFIQGFKIYVHPQCVNFITEINNYTWIVDKTGKTLNKPIDDHNHLMDAMRYALEDTARGNVFSFD